MNKVLIPIIIGIGLSTPFLVIYPFSGIYTTDPIDPRILEFYGEFVLQSDVIMYSVDLADDDDLPYVVLTFVRTPAGYVVMDDPLPLFQELFPDKNVTTLVVLAGGKEIPHYTEDNLLRFNFSNTGAVLIRGE